MFHPTQSRAKARALPRVFLPFAMLLAGTLAAGFAPLPAAPPPATPAPAETAPPVVAPPPGREIDCLAQAVYYEARGESADGQAAVAQVVINRTRQGGSPRPVCGVVGQRARAACQVRFACAGRPRIAREPAAWRRSRAVASRALTGYVMRQVGPATSFHAAASDAPPRPGAGLVRVARLGGQVFYCARPHRKEGSWPRKSSSSSRSSRG